LLRVAYCRSRRLLCNLLWISCTACCMTCCTTNQRVSVDWVCAGIPSAVAARCDRRAAAAAGAAVATADGRRHYRQRSSWQPARRRSAAAANRLRPASVSPRPGRSGRRAGLQEAVVLHAVVRRRQWGRSFPGRPLAPNVSRPACLIVIIAPQRP